MPDRANHVVVPATPATVHWGYFSRSLEPVTTLDPGDFVTIETLTHHAYDDHQRMIAGDPGAESVFHWTKEAKNVDRRGAGPLDASLYARGAGEGLGVHLCTGPIHVRGAGRATSSKSGSSMCVRAAPGIPPSPDVPSAAMRRLGGASNIMIC